MSYYGNERVKTTDASGYDPQKGSFAIIAPATRRSWKKDFGGAFEHAANLIDAGNGNEFLIIKVVARVKRRPTPVVLEIMED